jgi:hypothetical protein
MIHKIWTFKSYLSLATEKLSSGDKVAQQKLENILGRNR